MIFGVSAHLKQMLSFVNQNKTELFAFFSFLAQKVGKSKEKFAIIGA